MADSIGQSVPQEILPPQNGSSLNTPHNEDGNQYGILSPTPQQHQQQTQQQQQEPTTNNNTNNTRTNSSGCLYHGGYSAPSGVPSFLSAANQFGDGGGGNLNSSNDDDDDGEGDDDFVRGMYGGFKDTDEEDHGEEES